jgi:PAS domain S-box-containing protein
MMSQPQRTILIVDDSAEDRELYRRCLLRDQEYSYKILEAELGRQGLELWHQHQPDIVLLDYRLPDLDGLEFLAQLQTEQPFLPVLVVTGQGNEAIAVQAIKAGAQDYLVKGQISPESLQVAVNSAIEAVQLRSQLQQRIEGERLIGEISQQIHQSLNLEQIFQTTVDAVRQFLHTDRVVVFQLQSDGNGVVVAESVTKQWQSLKSSSFYDPCLAENNIRRERPAGSNYDPYFNENYVEIYRQGWVTAKSDIYDGSIDPCHVKLLAQFQVRANLVIPITHDQQFWGLLIVHHCSGPRVWRSLEIELLQQLTTHVSIALRQAQLYEQVQESEELKRRMLESSSDCIKLLDLDGQLLYMNAGGMCLMEIDNLDDYLQQKWSCFWSDELQSEIETAIARTKAGKLSRFQGYCATAKGTPKFWDVIISPVFNTTGQVVQLLAVSRDITQSQQIELDLRESEERYRCLIESIPQLVWTATDDGTILDVNQRWLDFTGFNLEQIQTLGWQTIVHPEDAPHLNQQWALAIQSNNAYYQAEGRMRRSDGTYRWHLHQARAQTNDRGQIVKWFGTATDIEAQKQLEIERDRVLEWETTARAEAERASRIKDEFLAIVSHELRSPLNPILGWSQLLQTQNFDQSRMVQGLEIIERNAKLQSQLIDDLLDVAKILRGKLSLNITPLNLALAIQSALEAVKTTAAAKSVCLNLVIPNIGQISGDFTRFQQIIWNLLSNAIKFTPAGGQVDVRLEQIDNLAQITVSDTGKGINSDFLPHIFEYFRQEDPSITRNHGGLGLGLAIVYHLVEAHGGTISAESDGEDLGATFTVTLPLIDLEPEIEQTNGWSNRELDLTGIRVLYVDDQPDARELLKVLLTQYGAKVMTVASATEALRIFKSFPQDILVSDIGMPETNGYNLIEQIRSLSPEKGGQIPAIALTAYAAETDRERALSSGFQEHLPKPFNSNQLIQTMLTLVRNQSSIVSSTVNSEQ